MLLKAAGGLGGLGGFGGFFLTNSNSSWAFFAYVPASYSEYCSDGTQRRTI